MRTALILLSALFLGCGVYADCNYITVRPHILTQSEHCYLYPSDCSGEYLGWLSDSAINRTNYYIDGQFHYSDTQDQFLIFAVDSSFLIPSCSVDSVVVRHYVKQLRKNQSTGNKFRTRVVQGEAILTSPPITIDTGDYIWYEIIFTEPPQGGGWSLSKLKASHFIQHSYAINGQPQDSLWTMQDRVEVRIYLSD